MPRIAISYRRSDSAAIAGRIFDWLGERYGEDSVFMDIDKIPFGTDFRSHIREVLLRTDVLIAVVGANWLSHNDTGASRIQDAIDPVRVEIETALERKIAIIPVLVDGAKMPGSGELPATFGNFAYLNAPEISSGRDFRLHMERLIAAIDGGPQPASTRSRSFLSNWLVYAVRYVLVPLVVLLVAHYAIVNVLNLNTDYLRLVCAFVPFAAGFALGWIGRSGAGPATLFALALGLMAVAGMTISESLYSGDPMLPHTRFEWVDNFQFVATIVLSFIAGQLVARTSRAVWHRRLG
jgi:hypothetical protein